MIRFVPAPGARAVFVLACLGLWYVASEHGHVNPLLLPSFRRTMADLWSVLSNGELWPDLLVTLRELAIAYALALVAGLCVGVLVGRSAFSTRVGEPLLSALYSAPTILLFPLFVLFFGIGDGSKIALGACVAFFPIALTTIAGLANVDAALVTAARSMGANGWRLFWFVLAPSASRVIIGGLRLGLIVALLSILGGETISSLAGLGHQIVYYSDAMETSRMFAYTILVLVIASALNGAVTALENLARRRMG